MEDSAEVVLTASSDHPLRSFRVAGPRGLVHRATSPSSCGVEELRFQTPSLRLGEVQDRFPAGRYRISGRDLQGRLARGFLELTYDLPPTPVLLTPTVLRGFPAHDPIELRWIAMPEHALELSVHEGPDAEDDDGEEDDLPEDLIRIKIPPHRDRLLLPADLLEPNSVYTVVLSAVSPHGNRSCLEVELYTR